MYYIQRFIKVSREDQKRMASTKTIRRILKADYMGSAEFEFGSVSSSLHRLSCTRLKLHRVLIDSENYDLTRPAVPIFLITSDERLPYVTEKLTAFLGRKGDAVRVKESTRLTQAAKSFFSEKPNLDDSYLPSMWLDVTPYVYESRKAESPTFFTLDIELILRVYLHLTRVRVMPEDFNYDELRMGDEVYYYRKGRIVAGKICGLNEGDTISVKYHRNTQVISKYDMIPANVINDSMFVQTANDSVKDPIITP